MRNICAAFLAVALVSTSAFAASNNAGLLAPGKPAGVSKAQSGSTVAAMIAGTAALALLAALITGGGDDTLGAVSDNNGGNGGGTTTTTTTAT